MVSKIKPRRSVQFLRQQVAKHGAVREQCFSAPSREPLPHDRCPCGFVPRAHGREELPGGALRSAQHAACRCQPGRDLHCRLQQWTGSCSGQLSLNMAPGRQLADDMEAASLAQVRRIVAHRWCVTVSGGVRNGERRRCAPAGHQRAAERETGAARGRLGQVRPAAGLKSPRVRINYAAAC